MRVVLRVLRVTFTRVFTRRVCVACAICTCRLPRRVSCALPRVIRARAAVLFRACRRVLFACCHATRTLSRECSHVIRALFVCRRYSFARSCRASDSRVARISHVDHVCRAASTRDNKLFLLMNTHVNNIDLLDHIF
jgi:hypothetical protein